MFGFNDKKLSCGQQNDNLIVSWIINYFFKIYVYITCCVTCSTHHISKLSWMLVEKMKQNIVSFKLNS